MEIGLFSSHEFRNFFVEMLWEFCLNKEDEDEMVYLNL
jgi:hypothetical protein